MIPRIQPSQKRWERKEREGFLGPSAEKLQEPYENKGFESLGNPLKIHQMKKLLKERG